MPDFAEEPVVPASLGFETGGAECRRARPEQGKVELQPASLSDQPGRGELAEHAQKFGRESMTEMLAKHFARR